MLSKEAIRLNPVPPPVYFTCLGNSYRETGQYEEAIAVFKEGIARYPEYVFSRVGLVIAYCATGGYEEAKAEMQKVFKLDPCFSLEQYVMRFPYEDRAVNERLATNLRQAGLLE